MGFKPYLKDQLLQCFDTVGLVILPVKIVSNMTYNVFGGMLNLAQSINQSKDVFTRSANIRDTVMQFREWLTDCSM